MRKAAALMSGLILLLSMVACSPSMERHSYQKVKCPACGYEFSTPQQ